MKILSITPGKGKLYEITLEDEQKLWLHADLVPSEFLRPGDDLDEERINAWTMEQSKKLWGTLNNRTY